MDRYKEVETIGDIIAKIEKKVREDEENFIFETIGPYCNEVARKKLSKKDLQDAIRFWMDNGCPRWQPKVENHSIKMVTNAKEAENYPISEDISKDIEEINKLIFENGQAESEDKNEL